MSHQQIASSRFLIFIGVPVLVSIFNFCASQRWISDYETLSSDIISQSIISFSAGKRSIKEPCNETTVIITSSFVPSTPSLTIINHAIQSLKHLHGLCPTSPVIITVDGLNPDIMKRGKRVKKKRMEKYIKALRETYTEDYHRILAHDRSLMITGNVKSAMDIVQTEFVYVLQHDMPFIQDINHSAIIKTMREFPNDLRLVRFNRRPNVGLIEQTRNITCYNSSTPVSHVNGLHFVKTWIWSDNNHLTRKSYYEEMFRLFNERYGRLPFAMEYVMRLVAKENCSYWGPFYYGPYGHPPTIAHLDGKRTKQEK